MDLSMLLKAKFEEQAIEDPYDSRPVDLILVRETRQMPLVLMVLLFIYSFFRLFVVFIFRFRRFQYVPRL